MSEDLERLAGLVERLEVIMPVLERALAPPAPPREVVVARPARFTKDRSIDGWIAARVVMDGRATTSSRVLYRDFVKTVSAPGLSHPPQRRFVGRLLELPGVSRAEGRPVLNGLRLRVEGDAAP